MNDEKQNSYTEDLAEEMWLRERYREYMNAVVPSQALVDDTLAKMRQLLAEKPEDKPRQDEKVPQTASIASIATVRRTPRWLRSLIPAAAVLVVAFFTLTLVKVFESGRQRQMAVVPSTLSTEETRQEEPMSRAAAKEGERAENPASTYAARMAPSENAASPAGEEIGTNEEAAMPMLIHLDGEDARPEDEEAKGMALDMEQKLPEGEEASLRAKAASPNAAAPDGGQAEAEPFGGLADPRSNSDETGVALAFGMGAPAGLPSPPPSSEGGASAASRDVASLSCAEEDAKQIFLPASLLFPAAERITATVVLSQPSYFRDNQALLLKFSRGGLLANSAQREAFIEAFRLSFWNENARRPIVVDGWYGNAGNAMNGADAAQNQVLSNSEPRFTLNFESANYDVEQSLLQLSLKLEKPAAADRQMELSMLNCDDSWTYLEVPVWNKR